MAKQLLFNKGEKQKVYVNYNPIKSNGTKNLYPCINLNRLRLQTVYVLLFKYVKIIKIIIVKTIELHRICRNRIQKIIHNS